MDHAEEASCSNDRNILKDAPYFRRKAVQHVTLNGIHVFAFAAIMLFNQLMMDIRDADRWLWRGCVVMLAGFSTWICIDKHYWITWTILVQMRAITREFYDAFLATRTGSYPAQKTMKRSRRTQYKVCRWLCLKLLLSLIGSMAVMLVMIVQAIWLLASS